MAKAEATVEELVRMIERGQSVDVRGHKKPIELLFNLDHPGQLAVVTEVNSDRISGTPNSILVSHKKDSLYLIRQKFPNSSEFRISDGKTRQLAV